MIPWGGSRQDKKRWSGCRQLENRRGWAEVGKHSRLKQEASFKKFSCFSVALHLTLFDLHHLQNHCTVDRIWTCCPCDDFATFIDRNTKVSKIPQAYFLFLLSSITSEKEPRCLHPKASCYDKKVEVLETENSVSITSSQEDFTSDKFSLGHTHPTLKADRSTVALQLGSRVIAYDSPLFQPFGGGCRHAFRCSREYCACWLQLFDMNSISNESTLFQMSNR